MNRKEFGELVATLRREHTDEELRQWSAKVLASKANLPKGTVEAIEQGKLKKIDSEILVKLANALELTTMERKEFFLASIGLDSREFAQEFEEFNLDNFLRTVSNIPLPAFVSDNYGDIVAANNCIINFLGISPQFIRDSLSNLSDNPEALNLMRVICSLDSGYRATLGDGWDANVIRNMLFFRRITLRYRSTRRFKALWTALMKSKTFRDYWQAVKYRDDANDTDLEVYSYRHTFLSQDVKYIAAVNQIITADGERYMTTYIPANQQVAKFFEGIAQESGIGWRKFPAWSN